MRQRGHESLFIGTRGGLESRLVPQAGFPIEWIGIGGLNRVGVAQTLRTLWQLPRSVWRSWMILRRTRPAAVFSMGGYVAAPVVLAAVLRGVPVVVMEPNAMPGLVSRSLARFVRRALVAFGEAQSFFPEGRSEVCGLPVRQEFFEVGDRQQSDVFTVLLTGGSRGARALNRIARDCWPLLAKALSGQPAVAATESGGEAGEIASPGREPHVSPSAQESAGAEDSVQTSTIVPTSIRWIHQSGLDEFETMRAAFAESGLEGQVAPFFPDMAIEYAGADLIISRSGAGAVSEIAAAGRPAILVPFPYAADDHQKHNAQAFERAGAALLFDQVGLTGATLCDAIVALAKEPARRREMGRQARALAHHGAARRAADVLEEVAAAH
jgi:UDP-N-acetylglucosamine--N-acetylmuramyl-(pentapeptide) pyrophosphoryl-undecaprenol N-acetylglucosamine transferase